MTRKLSVILALLLCLALCASASAEIISFNGTVAVKDTVEVYAPIGGTVESVPFSAGQSVKADDVLVNLKTTKVYATQAGKVTGVFGQPGDSADTVSSRYGAVMYIEGNAKYTISASTDNAYNATENKYVSIGETVYITSRSDSTHKGSGIITAVSGTNYTIEVQNGTFDIGESCDIYRESSRSTSSRIGRGSTSRVNPVSVTASGSIVSYAVKDGDTVQRGQLLLETLDGSFDGLYMSGSAITAGVDGVVASVSANKGSNVQKNSVVAVIYPTGSMRIEGSISENDLMYIKVGDPVEIEMNWNSDEGEVLQGTVSFISAVASGNGDSASYTVYIDFTADAGTRYGMTCIVSTIETEIEEEAEEVEEVKETEEQPAEETAAEQTTRPEGFPEGMERPEGFPEGMERPEGFPEGAPDGTTGASTTTESENP